MNLIQSNVKYYVGEILSKCHERKITIYYWIFNIFVLTLFLTGTFCILYYCYKRKPSNEELRQKMIMDQQYILEQIRFYQGQMKSSSEITDLPTTLDPIHVSDRTAIERKITERNGVYNPNIF